MRTTTLVFLLTLPALATAQPDKILRVVSPDLRALIESGPLAHVVTMNPDGSPQVTVVWIALDGDDVVSAHMSRYRKLRNIERDPRISILVDDEQPPFAFVHMRGTVTISEDPEELLRTATEIGARYMGADRAEEFGRRNAVPWARTISFASEFLGRRSVPSTAKARQPANSPD